MSLTAKATNSDFELAPEGTHVAICYAVVDMGLQEVNWQGQSKMQHKVWIAWELCDELMNDGRPFSVSNRYTLSLGDKAKLREHLNAWRGRSFTPDELQGFDLFNVLGVPCMVTVTHSDGEKKYANIQAVTSLPKGINVPDRSNDLIKFSLEEYDDISFEKLPDWLKEKINKDELPPSVSSNTDDLDDDIPF